jgi:hypothetical protein
MTGEYDGMFSVPTNPLERTLSEAGVDTPVEQQAYQPLYKVMPDSKIPVSKRRGSMWKTRIDSGKRLLTPLTECWDESIAYYNNDQSGHRDQDGNPDRSGNRKRARRLNDTATQTENIVFANVSAMVPSIYAKNPVVEVTRTHVGEASERDVQDQKARAIEKLVDVLFAMKALPGVNIKPKARRAVVLTLLTNRCYFEVGYTQKQESSEQALQDIVKLSQDLIGAKTTQEIQEIEGKLIALEEKVAMAQPAGPFVNLLLPHQVIIDPDHSDMWLTDANWLAIFKFLPTSYLNAMYGGEKDQHGQVTSLYEPTHILTGEAADDATETVNNFKLLGGSTPDYKSAGFSDKESYEKAQHTKVWYVWDRVTKRLELYADNKWQWPIWVWDDPLQLDSFYPLTPLQFHENPIAPYAKGEVSYYLDQQDAINEINDERRRSRLWARRNIVYNPAYIQPSDVDKILKGHDETAVALSKVPDGMKISDVIQSIVPPSSQFMQLFDTKPELEAIGRISSVSDVLRGGQFKTNTTNQAIEAYNSVANMRLDERIDCIEESLGDVGWKIAQLCLRFMPPETVKDLTGIDVTSFWGPIDSFGDRMRMNMRVVGGSTQKPTSAAKKQEAVQVGQALGQFAKAAPVSVLTFALKLFEQAFDEITITDEDWRQLREEAQQQISGATAGAGPAQGPESGAAPAGGGDPMQMMQQAVQLLDSLPDGVRRAIGAALAQGASAEEIASEVINNAAQPGQTQEQGNAPA